MLNGRINKQDSIRIKKSLYKIKSEIMLCNELDSFESLYNDLDFDNTLKEVLYSSGYISIGFSNSFKIKIKGKDQYRTMILNFNGLGLEFLTEGGEIISSDRLMNAGKVCKQSFLDCLPNVIDRLDLFVDNNTGPSMVMASKNEFKKEKKHEETS